MTKKEVFKRVYEMLSIADFPDKDEILQKVKREIESLENKSNNKRPTAKQTANEEFKELILNILITSEEPMTIADMQRINDVLAGLSNQKISALIKQLRSEGKVKRTLEKKVAYFSIGNESEIE